MGQPRLPLFPAYTRADDTRDVGSRLGLVGPLVSLSEVSADVAWQAFSSLTSFLTVHHPANRIFPFQRRASCQVPAAVSLASTLRGRVATVRSVECNDVEGFALYTKDLVHGMCQGGLQSRS